MLAGIPIFANLSQEHLKALEEITQGISLAKGAQLFAPGDPSRGFYVVRDGAVRVYGRSSQGKEITQEIADPGSAFALASPFAGTYHCFAEALQDSRLFLIKRQGFLDLATGDKQFAIEWMRMLSLMVINLRRRLIDLTLTPPKSRIASYLLLLAEMQDSPSITLPVPRRDLANFLGMTHETFYRTAKELANDGLVRFTGQSVDILDRNRLAEMTE
ncbi:MAG: Crp/Fnr family transcriptional regulator [Syntrophobacterales bacterium]|jgi:CRP/FNR family transcriptional regulator|nr:Crp/Fnr family transcriptional regulator [Syntrophobacterales bacterium]